MQSFDQATNGGAREVITEVRSARSAELVRFSEAKREPKGQGLQTWFQVVLSLDILVWLEPTGLLRVTGWDSKRVEEAGSFLRFGA